MKKFATLVSLVLVAILALGMTGCSSYGSLKKAFEKEGYKESATAEALAKDIKDAAETKEFVTNVHVLSNGMKIVLITEFKSTENMKKFYDENKAVRTAISDITSNEDAKNFYNSLEEKGYAKGNCLVIPITANAKDVQEIVKNA